MNTEIHQVQLSELVHISKGQKHNILDAFVEGSTRYIQLEDLRDDLNIKYTDALKGTTVEPKDLIIAWDGTNAGTVSYGLKGLIGSTLARLKFKNPSQVYTPYIGRFLQSQFKHIQEKCIGATIPHVSRSFLLSLKVPFPSLKEQKRIAQILDKTDKLRGLYEQRTEQTRELLYSIFLDMFGDPMLNPKDWETKKLREVITVKSGSLLSQKNMNQYGIYNVYGGNGISGKHDQYLFEDPQIVIGRVGAYCGVIHRTTPKCWITDNALFIHTYLIEIHPTFLEWSLRIANLNQYASQVAQPLISSKRIYEIKFNIPPLEEQKKFAHVVDKIRALYKSHSIQTAYSNNLFNSLLQRSFKGTL